MIASQLEKITIELLKQVATDLSQDFKSDFEQALKKEKDSTGKNLFEDVKKKVEINRKQIYKTFGL